MSISDLPTPDPNIEGKRGVSVKDGGEWKTANRVYIKDSGSWKAASKIYVKENGAWKVVFSPEGTPPSVLTNGTITGTGVIGSALSYSVATFDGDPAPDVTYVWLAGTTQVAGQQTSYTPTANDLGKEITVKATASNDIGTADATSNSVTVSGTAPQPTSNGTLSGNTAEGSTLTYTAATFSGNPTPAISWEWQRDGSTFKNGGNQYTTTSTDADKVITVKATGSNAAGSASATSNGIKIVPKPTTVTFQLELIGAGGSAAWNGSMKQGEGGRGGYAKYSITAPEGSQIRIMCGTGAQPNGEGGAGYTKGGTAPNFPGTGNRAGSGGGSTGCEFNSGSGWTWIAVAGGGGGAGKQQTNTPSGQDGYGYGRQGSPSNGQDGGVSNCGDPIYSGGGGGGGGASGGSAGSDSCGSPGGGGGGGGNYNTSPLSSVGGSISLLSSQQGNPSRLEGFGGWFKITRQSGSSFEGDSSQWSTYNVSDLK